ncbi:MAG: UDP-3-O-(3-hydroxymyristoyl)glucosamine N-acyltransferase [Bacteroidales bacterium]|nr:UDP-3-O-(3-hydroxymyristoyl)glucosamine N-acyltransferase [Bacteroidales bacterium]
MEFTAKTISEFLRGTIVGNPDEKVSEISKIEEGKKGSLSFLSNPKYTKYLYTTDASIVLVNKDLTLEDKVKATLILVDNAYEAFASLLQLYTQSLPKKLGIDKEVYISSTCKYGKDIYIGAFTYIGENVKIGNNVSLYPQVYVGDNVTIGDNTIIYPGVKIYHDCIIGSGCTIHGSTVIGSDGFGFAPQQDNEYKKIPQIGNVIIEDSVEIGSNVSIDRATIGSTIIRKGVKIDNLIQVAHNVEIGANTVIAAQSGISGSTKIGKDVMIAGQVGIVGHIRIADGVKIGAQSGVTNSIDKEGEIILGSPAYNISEKRREFAVARQLPNIYKKITDLEKEVQRLKDGEKKS